MSFSHSLFEDAGEGEGGREEQEQGGIAIEDSGLAKKGSIGVWGR